MQPEPSSLAGAQNFEGFRALVFEEPGLLAILAQSSTADELVQAVVARGAERGIALTEDVVRVALNEARRTWLERRLG